MKTATAPKEKTAKQRLTEEGAKLRKLEAAEKAAKAKKPAGKPKPSPAKKKTTTAIVDAVLPPPVVESKEDPALIATKYLKESKDGRSFVLSQKTPVEAYVPLLKHAIGRNEQSQWAIGDMVIQGRELYGATFETLMAVSGIPISSLRTYELTCRQNPPDIRLLDFSLHKAINKVKDLTKKREIIFAAAESAAKGHPVTTKEMDKKADSVKPRKKQTKKKSDKHTAKPPLVLSAAEAELYDELEDLAARLASKIEACSFVPDMNTTQTATFREKTDRIARFHALIS